MSFPLYLSLNLSGSVSVGHHLLNEESQNYFDQVFCMSSSALMVPAFQHGNHRCIMEIFAKHYGPIGNDTDMIKFLQKVPVEDILKLTDKTESKTDLLFAPVIESPYFFIFIIFQIYLYYYIIFK